MSRWSSEWPTAYPRATGPWTVRCGDRWGVLDPERAHAEAVEPSEDRRLPGLAGALPAGRLLGYRAGRRAVVMTPTSFVKVVRPKRVDALVERHELFSSGDQTFSVPTVIKATNDGRVELSTMTGLSLHQSIRLAPMRPLDTIGLLVASLHEQPAPTWLPVRKPDDPAAWVATSRRSPTVHLAAIEQAARDLPTLEPRADVVVHGDLHDKNILCDTTQRAFIDLDGLGLGSAEEDVANLSVHLELRNLQAGTGLPHGTRSRELYRSYQRARPLDLGRLAAVERHTWFRLACLYQYRTASRTLVPHLLRAASGASTSL